MKNGAFIAFLFPLIIFHSSGGALAAPLPQAQPCDIVDTVSHFVVPRIHCQPPTTLQEALDWISHRYRDVETDIDGSRDGFVFEYRLPEATLHRVVTVDARNLTMIQAIKRIFGDTPVVLTFETGKLVFSEPEKKKAPGK